LDASSILGYNRNEDEKFLVRKQKSLAMAKKVSRKRVPNFPFPPRASAILP
jgi:hypothetical protein